jgi:ATP-binding cassette subfamily B protein
VVLDRGSVVEVGHHNELMARAGHYYGLYQAQVRKVDVAPDDLSGTDSDGFSGEIRE